MPSTRPTTPLTLLAPTLTALGSLLTPSLTHAQSVTQAHILAPQDPTDFIQFGNHVDIHDGIAIVSGLGLWTIPVPGAAYLFDAGTGNQLAKLDTPLLNGPEQLLFGAAIGPARAIVATRNWAFTPEYNPRAWLFDITDPAAPAFLTLIQPDDATTSDDFGDAITIHNNIAAIGAPANNANGALSGAAYLFDTTDATQLAKLTPSDGQPIDQFGWSIDLDDTHAIIGARWEDDIASNAGAAYLFDISDPSNPIERAKLTPFDGDINDYFGYAVAIEGNIAAVGSIFDDDLGLDAGAVYLYDITDPANPSLIKKLLADDGNPTDDFGWSLALDNNTLLVGARTDDDIFPGAGSAYLFDITNPQSPVEITKITASDTSPNATFGWSAALHNNTAIIGASQSSATGPNQGQAYLFNIEPIQTPCPGDLNNDAVVDTTDLGILLGAFGNTIPPSTNADINNDGIVNTTDLGILLGAFGANC